MHDPRVGRFFAEDPLKAKYPHNSPYAFSENRVMDGVELEGLEVQLINPDRTKPAATPPDEFKSDMAHDKKIVNASLKIENSSTSVTVTAHANPKYILDDKVNPEERIKIKTGAQFDIMLKRESDAWKNKKSNSGITITIYACRSGSDIKDENGNTIDIGIAQKISGSPEFKGVMIITPDQRMYFGNEPKGTYKAEHAGLDDEYL